MKEGSVCAVTQPPERAPAATDRRRINGEAALPKRTRALTAVGAVQLGRGYRRTVGHQHTGEQTSDGPTNGVHAALFFPTLPRMTLGTTGAATVTGR